jgi:CheY-like chemotaxis protein
MKKLLLIDDDPDEHYFFRQAIREINPNYECFTSDEEHETLHELIEEKIKPNFVFLDLNMPRMKGNDFLRQMKEIPHLAQIPVIIYTTSMFNDEIKESLKLGASSFLTKPILYEDTVASIKQIID